MSDIAVFCVGLRAALISESIGICFLLCSVEEAIALTSTQFLLHVLLTHSLAGSSPWNILRALWNSAWGRIEKQPGSSGQWKQHPKESSGETDLKIFYLAILRDEAMSDLIKWWQVLTHMESWTRGNPQHRLQTDVFVILWLRLQEDGKKKPGPSAESGTHNPQ